MNNEMSVPPFLLQNVTQNLISVVQTPATNQTIQGNNLRYALLFWWRSGGQQRVAPQGIDASTSGYSPTSTPNISLFHSKDYGPIIQLPWVVNTQAGGPFFVWELNVIPGREYDVFAGYPDWRRDAEFTDNLYGGSSSDSDCGPVGPTQGITAVSPASWDVDLQERLRSDSRRWNQLNSGGVPRSFVV